MPEYVFDLPDGRSGSLDWPVDMPQPIELAIDFKPASEAEFVNAVEVLGLESFDVHSPTQYRFGVGLRRDGEEVGSVTFVVTVPDMVTSVRPEFGSVRRIIEQRDADALAVRLNG